MPRGRGRRGGGRRGRRTGFHGRRHGHIGHRHHGFHGHGGHHYHGGAVKCNIGRRALPINLTIAIIFSALFLFFLLNVVGAVDVFGLQGGPRRGGAGTIVLIGPTIVTGFIAIAFGVLAGCSAMAEPVEGDTEAGTEMSATAQGGVLEPGVAVGMMAGGVPVDANGVPIHMGTAPYNVQPGGYGYNPTQPSAPMPPQGVPQGVPVAANTGPQYQPYNPGQATYFEQPQPTNQYDHPYIAPPGQPGHQPQYSGAYAQGPHNGPQPPTYETAAGVGKGGAGGSLHRPE